jgi:tetratricopeptide (TPR) repeat protein
MMCLVRSAWTAEGFGYTPLAPACLSCLLEADRYNDLTALLSLKRHRFWPDERFAAEALLRRGRSEEALAFAEGLLAEERGSTYRHEIASFCEHVLLDLGRAEEAYRHFALPMAAGATYLATWRALTKRYPDRPTQDVLADLIETRGEKGKWFAAAKTAGCFDIALDCASAYDADPRTLIRAARDFVEEEPSFATNVALRAIALLLGGRGYDIVPGDAADAVEYLRSAARVTDCEAWAIETVERMAEDSGPAGAPMLPALQSALKRGDA